MSIVDSATSEPKKVAHGEAFSPTRQRQDGSKGERGKNSSCDERYFGFYETHPQTNVKEPYGRTRQPAPETDINLAGSKLTPM